MIGTITRKPVTEIGYTARIPTNRDLTDGFHGEVVVRNGGGYGDRVVISGLGGSGGTIRPNDAALLAAAINECVLYIGIKKEERKQG